MCDKNLNVDIVGYFGGIILSICLIPQIIKIFKTKQVDNISYIWQFLYILGLSLHLYYALYNKLLPVYIPTIIELLFILFLTFLKYIFTKRNIEEKQFFEKTKTASDV